MWVVPVLSIGDNSPQRHGGTKIPSTALQRYVWFGILCVSVSLWQYPWRHGRRCATRDRKLCEPPTTMLTSRLLLPLLACSLALIGTIKLAHRGTGATWRVRATGSTVATGQADRSRVAAARSRDELAARLVTISATMAEDDTEQHEGLFTRFVQSLNAQETLWLLLQLDELTSEEGRAQLRWSLLSRLAELDPRPAATFAQSLADEALRDHGLKLVMESWTQSDPEAAATWLQGFERPSRNGLLDEVIAGWSTARYDEALSWARDRADGSVKERALIHLSYRWLETDPRQAMEYAWKLQSATHQLVTTLASEWARRDPQAAAGWAAQLPEGPPRAQVIASLTAAWAESSPRDAAVFAASLPAGETQTEAMVSAISGWARLDPPQAVQWAMLFPESGMRELAFTHVVPAWGERDAASAAEWLVQMPDGPGKDAAFDAFSGAMVDRYPSIALTFAQSISDNLVRRARSDFVARRWLAASPEAAMIGLRQAKLPDDVLARLIPNKPE